MDFLDALSAAADILHHNLKDNGQPDNIPYPKDGFGSIADLEFWIDNASSVIVKGLLQSAICVYKMEETHTEAETE